MVGNMQDSGKKANSMEKEPTLYQMELLKMVSGKKVRGPDGMMTLQQEQGLDQTLINDALNLCLEYEF
jgi:hypothetical protein